MNAKYSVGRTVLAPRPIPYGKKLPIGWKNDNQPHISMLSQNSHAETSKSLLFQAGEALYGRDWQSPLARALGINLRRMQRWATGEYQPSEDNWRDIVELLCERQISLSDVYEKLITKLASDGA
jgi:hypothetical protein